MLGVVLTLGNFDIIDARGVLRFWPVLLIIFGGVRLVEPGPGSGRIFGAFVAVVGVILLLNRLDIIDTRIWSFWPLLLIAIGGALIWRTQGSTEHITEEADDLISGTAILGGLEQRSTSQHFRGGNLSAIMGGHEVDLRDADMPEGEIAVLDIFTLMGGVELRVPEQWNVALEGSAFLGGYENKARGSATSNKRLIIRGQSIMGGVEIKN